MVSKVLRWVSGLSCRRACDLSPDGTPQISFCFRAELPGFLQLKGSYLRLPGFLRCAGALSSFCCLFLVLGEQVQTLCEAWGPQKNFSQLSCPLPPAFTSFASVTQ